MKNRFWWALISSLFALCVSAEADTLLVDGEGVNQNDVLLAQQPAVRPLPSQSGSPLQPMPPLTTPPSAPPDLNALAQVGPLNNVNSSARTPGYSLASTTNMIGDTLGVGFFFKVEGMGGKPPQVAGNVPQGDGTIKISEDCSPLPVDRVFFDYNHFENALVTANGTDISLNRYTVGVEKTFLNGLGSVEIKLPFDSGVSAIQSTTATTPDNQGTLFGTMAITPKILLFQNDQWAMSAGLGVGLPTSPNAGLNALTEQIRVFDDAVHVAPFVGLLLTPNERWFSITYLQFDFDTTGDRVTVDGTPEGTLRDPTLMYVDCSVGYWLFNNRLGTGGGEYLTGMAPILELHYTKALDDAMGIQPFIEPESNTINALNLTAGFFFQLGSSSGLTVAGVAPLRTSRADKQFDAEVLVQFNRWFY
ncbi:MAG TPA: hypothetical protein VGJ04_01530 [Pirellulales bacterium]|jgi:hypothetical protein